MNLRSGRQIRATNAEIASKISTQGSGIRSVVGNLESTLECLTSDTHSESTQFTEANMDNDLEMSRDMHSNWELKGKTPMNPFNELADELEYEIALMFVYTNVYGAEIYKEDPLGHYTFKSAEHRTPFNETPMVNYQGDQYMGTDEARYVVTKYPDLVDALGVLQTDKVPTFE